MKLTYYGHSCIGIQTGDAQLLFDPFISGNPLAKAIDMEKIPATHVLLSHGHGDHVADAQAILKRTGAMLVSNAEICSWYEAKGIKHATPMNIGGEADLGSFRVRLTVAQHSSTMPDGGSGGDPCGFVIRTGEGNIHHAGDTGLMLDMQLLKRYSLRFACLPIGDNYTMGYADAVEAARYMGVNTVVGMHYNTFPAITIDIEAAKTAFAAANINLLLPAIGETIEPLIEKNKAPMAKIIAIVNQKGGVGKTTTAINLAACLGILERRTLIVDADPQANATSGTGLDPRETQSSIYESIVNGAPAKDVIQTTDNPNLDILPGSIDLVGAEIEMIDMEEREHRMKKVLDPLRELYDFIIIDCSPSLGLVTVNALVAADSVIVPVQCEYFALEGLGKLLNTIKIIQQRLNPELMIEGMLLTMYDSRLRLANQVVEEVKTHFQQLVFDTVIHRNVALGEAPSHGQTIIMHDASSKGAVNYLNLAREVLQKNDLTRIKEQERTIAIAEEQ